MIDLATVEDIEKPVEQLTPRELARFRAWFEAIDAEQFDVAIERDISAGSLTRTRMKPLPRTAPGARATCEAFRFTEILAPYEALPLPIRKPADAHYRGARGICYYPVKMLR
jgi:hypothetical protein